MNDKHIPDNIDELVDDLFDQDVPPVSQAHKQQTMKMATEEFNQTFSQEKVESARPIDNRDTSQGWFSSISQSIWSFIMNTDYNSTAYKGFATAGVAFLAVSVFFMMPSTQTTTRTEELATVTTENIKELPVESKVQVPALEELVVTNRELIKQQAETNEIVVTAKRRIDSEVAQYSPPSDLNQATSGAQIGSTQPLADSAQTLAEPLTRGRSLYEVDGKAEVAASSQSIVAPLPTPRGDYLYPDTALNNSEEFAQYESNSIKLVTDEPVSTFSIDVDTASYSLVRNQLNSGRLPSPQAVRAEELINYFDYNYPTPNTKGVPFEPTISVFDSPWNDDKQLVHIGIKGYDIEASQQPDSNIVFLLDVSGSMNSANKLPLVKQSVSLLLDTLKPTDTVSIVVYAGAAGTVLEPTQAKNKTKIISALQNLNAGGSTAGGAGIQLAYQLAEQNFNKDAVNRIILATDGDFNVGMQSNEDLKTLVERKRSNGVFLSVLGFGRNNYQDDMMQTLAQNGNGVAAYIDSLSEAKKVLVDEATSTLFPIAKDVKIQVEFNPATVSEYRLIGYETRALNREDFNNDKVDAGDIGAGHTVTAIYEITPANAENKSIDEPRYAQNKAVTSTSQSNEYGFLKMRYKLPDSDVSKLIETPINAESINPDGEVQFSVAVAGFAQLLTNSEHTGDFSYNVAIDIANEHKGDDPFGYRAEFIQLVRMAQLANP